MLTFLVYYSTTFILTFSFQSNMQNQESSVLSKISATCLFRNGENAEELKYAEVNQEELNYC